MRQWLKEWWVTLRYGSVFTRSGRDLRRNLKDSDDPYCWVPVGPPSEMSLREFHDRLRDGSMGA